MKLIPMLLGLSLLATPPLIFCGKLRDENRILSARISALEEKPAPKDWAEEISHLSAAQRQHRDRILEAESDLANAKEDFRNTQRKVEILPSPSVSYVPDDGLSASDKMEEWRKEREAEDLQFRIRKLEREQLDREINEDRDSIRRILK